MTKNLEFGQDARSKMMVGVKKLARAVKCTLGPRGRNVVIARKMQTPSVTKDGVTVAREIFLKDKFEDMGAQLLKQAASKAADGTGDGTTTATVLAEAILTEGMRLVAADHDPMSLKRGIDKAVVKIVEELKKQSREVSGTKEIMQVAVISANGDQTIGSMIAEAMDKVGKSGVVTLEEGKNSRESTLRVTTGFEFDRGLIHPLLVSDTEKQRVVLEATKAKPVAVLLINGVVSTDSHWQDMTPVLEHCHQNDIPLLIIAENMSDAVLATLITNKLRGTLKVAAVRAPGFGSTRVEMLGDIAALTGANLRDTAAGDELVAGLSPDELGYAQQIIATKENTIIVGMDGREEAIEARVKMIRAQLDGEFSDWDRQKTEKRLAKFVGGVAVIEVGGETESAMHEKKDRFEDSLSATKAAVLEGIVSGGGVALVRAATSLAGFSTGNPEEDAGVKLLLTAVGEPLRQIAENAGQNGGMIYSEVLKQKNFEIGFDAATQTFQNMFEKGIIDPCKVVRVALETAADTAGLMLTMECAMVFDDEEPQPNSRFTGLR